MENKRMNAPVAEMIPIIKETADNGGVVEITVTGSSMKPLLIGGISSVKLAKADDLKSGSIVLYQSANGKCLLHRIVSVHNGVYDIVGDNQYVTDRNVPGQSIIAEVVAFNRKGKRWKNNDSFYRALLPVIKAPGYCAFRIKRKLRSLRKR